MDTSAIDYRLFMLSRSLARDTSSLVALFDKYRSSHERGHLLEASAIGCRSLKGLRDAQLAEILDTLYTETDKSLLAEAKGCFENRAAFDEFLEAEYSLLRLIGTSKEAAETIIEECRRLQRVALRPQNSRLLFKAFELLEKTICEGEQYLNSQVNQRRVVSRFGGWTLILANGALGAAAKVGALFTLGLTLPIGAGCAASAAYGANLARR